MSLSREEFVTICTNAILTTRNKITVRNQISGYKKYHWDIKENNYFSGIARPPLEATSDDDYMYRHDLIEHVGIGNCHELADFLLIEIGKEINSQGALARIRIVSSKTVDHTYLEIRIRLKRERDYSLWEADAWDPRIIDISTRPDGTIKNHEHLDYGYSTGVKNSVYTDEINYRRKFSFFEEIRKPIPGKPFRGATPERDMYDKHNGLLYGDYTIKEATKDGKCDKSGEIHYLQRVSSWQ